LWRGTNWAIKAEMTARFRTPNAIIRPLAGVIGLAVVGVVIVLGLAGRPALPAIDPSTKAAFDRGAVERGAGLAKIGDCDVCHTAQGPVYSGGLPIRTPFGTIYTANITPDPETGIGRWSKDAFIRAMTRGVARNGSHLYPAFPYDHFTHLAPQDLSDLYAFLMTREAVHARHPANRLIPPLGFRPLLWGWKLLFLKTGLITADPARPAEWNRGRYMVEALAHCGACHTPRDALGAEISNRAFSGGWSDGWYAPPLNGQSPAARRWTPPRLYTYLRTGLDPAHAAAAGPMGPVTRGLAEAPDADVRAIAVYIASLIAAVPAPRSEAPPVDHAASAAQANPRGALLFAGACANCHEAGAGMMTLGRPSLALGTPLRETTPRDVLQIILRGLKPPVGRSGPYMPGFAHDFTDTQAGEIAAYLRARFTDRPAWTDLAKAARQARKEGGS
jgi:mono/diheme cytochrome c family protein